MKKLAYVLMAASTLLTAQKIEQKKNEPPPQASFGLQDPSVIQRLPESKPGIISGSIPRLADGTPDLSGPWQPNAIRENVNLVAAGVKIPFNAAAKKIYDARIGVLGKDDPEAYCLPPGVPRLTTTPYPFRYLQVPGLVVIIYEGGSQTFRQIFTDGRGFSKFADELWIRCNPSPSLNTGTNFRSPSPSKFCVRKFLESKLKYDFAVFARGQ